MAQTERQRKALIEGLVGAREDEYRTSSHFYHSINALADMLPYWVDGIASEARRIDKNTDAAIRLMEQSVIGPDALSEDESE